jgi:ribonuclease III
MPELWLLRRPASDRDGVVTTTGLEALGVPPEGGALYDTALTHRSFAFEQTEAVEHNERLEFLGDAILGAVVTDLIFRTKPELAEGELARLRASLVNTHALADVARALGLGAHMRLGRGEQASGGFEKSSLLADTFEAVIGAVYLDRGIAAVHDALEPIFVERIEEATATKERYDAKNALQEEVVRGTGTAPTYTIESTGPDHNKRFTAEVLVGGHPFGAGTGRSKKEAEHNAARAALSRIEEEGWASAEEAAADARAS